MEIDNQASSSAAITGTGSTSYTYGSFGHQLKQARVDQKLSLEDVAGELFILKRHLQALEDEDFHALPQMAFARGFAINYAKFLKLDAEQIAESFDRVYPEDLKKNSANDIKSPLKPMGTLQREGRRSFKINPLLVLGVIALIALAVFLLRTVSNAQSASENSEEITNSVEELSQSEQLAGAAIDTGASGSALAVNNTGSALDLNNSSEEAVIQSFDGDGAAKLDFWIIGDTQLSVVDANGNVLVNGKRSRGGFKVLGQPPFKIEISNTDNVDLNLNGETVNIGKYAENNKASFTLSP